MEDFNAWKAKTMSKLIATAQKYQDNHRKTVVLEALINKLHYLRSKDLASFLHMLYHSSKEVEELAELVPSESEISKFISEGEGEL
jgi:predicted transcriptional regulator